MEGGASKTYKGHMQGVNRQDAQPRDADKASYPATWRSGENCMIHRFVHSRIIVLA